MNKTEIIEQINLFSELNFHLSDAIVDAYLQNKNIDAIGYGVYDKEVKNRYCLIIDLPNNKSKTCLVALLMNPASTFPAGILPGVTKSKFDQTIRNLIRLANSLQYNHIIVLNSFSYIEATGNKAKKYYQQMYKNSNEDKLNQKFIEYILNKANDLLIACGDGVEIDLYNKYIQTITNVRTNNKNIRLLTYAKHLTSKKRPRHLSCQSIVNLTAFKHALKSKKIYELKMSNNYFEVVK